MSQDHSHHDHWIFPPDRRHVLESEERRQSTPTQQVLDAAGLKAGETVVDVGAGTGFWAEPALERVGPEGRVYAVDIEPVMLGDLRTRFAGRANVEVVQSEETSVPLPDAIADLVILSYMLHEPAEPEVFLREVVRLLKPQGRVLLIDWHQKPTETGPPLERRISEEEARALLGAAGLTTEDIPSTSDDCYTMVGREFHPGDPEMMVPTI